MTSAAPSHTAKFVTGSTMRHVIVMTATASIGLVAIFIVDALNLFYISLLGVQSLTAAVGFAATLLFFTISFAIGLTIATSAVVSRALGRGDRAAAARLAGASLVYMALITAAITALVWPFLHELLILLGATGETLELSTRFLEIVMPSTPIVALGMGASGILRGVGDAKRAMYVTLAGGIAAAIFDPILIFGLKLGLDGAAISTILARCALLASGLYGAHFVHRLIALPKPHQLVAAARPFFAIGGPAVLTQLATPVGNAFVTAEIARFGDAAVAGWAIVGRIVPVAFGVIFALSGAVGPIIGQNFGARRYDRLQQTMRDSLTVTIVYVITMWALLALLSGPIASLFGATGQARELVIFFCLFVASAFLFDGAIFVSSAAFNNLGYPVYSTIFNWGRSTLGIIPFAWVGGLYFGAEGVLAGRGLGAILFGIASMTVCFRTMAGLVKGAAPEDDAIPALPPAANSPFSTGKASTLQ
jgi:putative MATE family efflux protein